MSMPGESQARRTAIVLAASQAIVGSAAPISFSVGGLAGYYLLDADKSLATIPVTAFTVGVAVGTVGSPVGVAVGSPVGVAVGGGTVS